MMVENDGSDPYVCQRCNGVGHLGPATGDKQRDYGIECPLCDGRGVAMPEQNDGSEPTWYHPYTLPHPDEQNDGSIADESEHPLSGGDPTHFYCGGHNVELPIGQYQQHCVEEHDGAPIGVTFILKQNEGSSAEPPA